MSNEPQIPHSLTRVEQHLNQLDIEIAEIYEPEEDHPYHEILANYGDKYIRFRLSEVHETEWIYVIYEYNIARVLGDSLDIDRYERFLKAFKDSDHLRDLPDDERAEVISENPDLSAGLYALTTVDEEEFEQFRYNLIMKISSPITAYSLSENEEMVWKFQIRTKLFPNRELFDIKDTSEALQAVASQGVQGMVFVNRVFNLKDTSEEVPDDLQNKFSMNFDGI